MKNKAFQEKLKRELPYPYITIRAEKVIDGVLAGLPEQEDLLLQESSTEELRPSPAAPAGQPGRVLLPGEKRRPVITLFRGMGYIFAALLMIAVGLFVMNPDVLVKLPVVGEALQQVSGSQPGAQGDFSQPSDPGVSEEEDRQTPAAAPDIDPFTGEERPPQTWEERLKLMTWVDYLIGAIKAVLLFGGAALLLWAVLGRKSGGENRMVGILDKLSFLRKL